VATDDEGLDVAAPTRRPGVPAVRGIHEASPTVGFLELFYDLVFVASTMVLSNAFSEDLTWGWAAVCAIVFALIWLLWFHTTLLMNVERRDDFGHRTLVLVQMFLIAMTTLAFVDRNFTASDYLGGTYGAAVIVVGLMYHRVHRRSEDVNEWARLRRNRLLIAGALMLVNSFTDDWIDNVVFVLAIVILVTPTRFGPVKRAPLPRVDVHHLTERAALLTLIMCGEAFVKVSLVVSGELDRTDVLAIVVEFVVVFALFWTYFDDVPLARVRPGNVSAELWMLAHLPLQLGIVALAVGMSKFLQIQDHVYYEAIVILSAAFALIYGGLAGVGLLGQRLPRRPLLVLRLATVAVAVVVGAAFWNRGWEPSPYLAVLAVLAVAHAFVAYRLRRSTTVVPGDAVPAAPQ
jgi:low temperature requirement protein LtrA